MNIVLNTAKFMYTIGNGLVGLILTRSIKGKNPHFALFSTLVSVSFSFDMNRNDINPLLTQLSLVISYVCLVLI